MIFEDITIDEENQLPLPDEWMRVTKYLGDRDVDGNVNNGIVRIYKNINNNQEIFEHPFIVKAMNRAKKMPLPPGWWVIQEPINGKEETFYVCPELQKSMWDHPHLRKCLAEVLNEYGYPDYIDQVQYPQIHVDNQIEEKIAVENIETVPSTNRNTLFETPLFDPSKDEEFLEDQYLAQPGNIIDQLPSFTESPIFHQAALPQHHSSIPNIGGFQLNFPLPEEDDEDDKEERSSQRSTSDSRDKKSMSHNNGHAQIIDRDWSALLQSYREPTSEYSEKVSHRITNVPPPMTGAGITILKSDIITANERVHQLLLKLRAVMTEKLGYQCTYLYYDEKNATNSPATRETNLIVTRASDLITSIRQQPDYVIMALSNRNLVQSLEMLEIAYLMIHRVLHPFSTDNSMTTALLLQSINYQLEELEEVEHLFSEMDSRLIISRAIFIHSAKQAIEWNGLWSPLPLVPNVNRETVFSCLMRCYALRRDVTGYFRAIWRPLLPAIAALFTSTEDLLSPVLFTNIITLAHRFLATTFSEQSMTVFPVIATAVSRAIYEIAGQETLLTFLFNYLILPNLIKIVCGDHDSLENEQFHSLAMISKTINQYFDQRWWFQNEEMEAMSMPVNASSPRVKLPASAAVNNSRQRYHSTTATTHGKRLQAPPNHPSNDDATNPTNYKSLKIIRSFIYMIWKLFSCAVYSTDAMITSMTMSEFLQDHLQYLTVTGYTDSKLRNLITRLRSKLQTGCAWLVKMPLDAQGSEYLGIISNNNVGSPFESNAMDPQDVNYYKQLYNQVHPNPSNPKTSQETYELLDRRMSFLQFKPNEILNLSVISRTELMRLFEEIMIGIEQCVHVPPDESSPSPASPVTSQGHSSFPSPEINRQKPGTEVLAQLHPIYQSIQDFLQLYREYYDVNQPTAPRSQVKKATAIQSQNSHVEEQFLQLSFLYDKVPLPNASEDEEYIAYEYKQLLRGLKLTNRYEDTLLHLLQKWENRITSNIFELLADNQWYLEPEFDTEFKVNHVEIAEKHTEGSRHKLRHPQYGLRKQPLIKVFPLFSQHNEEDYHPNSRSLASLQKDVIASYRFGSAQRSADVGTSLARQRVLPPKLQRGQLKVTTLPEGGSEASNRSQSQSHQPPTANNYRRSVFTEPTIKQNASLLAPTKSFLSSTIPKKYEAPTYQDKDKQFMKGMRDYQVIPTEEFQMRYFRRRRTRRYQQEDQGGHSSQQEYTDSYSSLSPYQKRKVRQQTTGGGANRPVAMSAAPAPKPFPEHLRNRIRGSEEAKPSSHRSHMASQPRPHPRNRQSNHYRAEEQETGEDYYAYYSSDQGGYEQGYEEEDYHHHQQQQPPPSENFFKQLIQDYHQTIKPALPGHQPSLERKMEMEELISEEHDGDNRARRSSNSPAGHLYADRGRSASPHSTRNSRPRSESRSRSPRMPSPITFDGISPSLLSPTEAVKHRFRSIEEGGPSNQFYRDLGSGAPPELRKYEVDPEMIPPHPEEFKPTRAKFYPPSGPRIPRDPDFLEPVDGEDVVYTSSRSASPTRRRSRSSSPAASTSRSRSSSYARATVSSLNQRSDRALALEQHQHQQQQQQQFHEQPEQALARDRSEVPYDEPMTESDAIGSGDERYSLSRRATNKPKSRKVSNQYQPLEVDYPSASEAPLPDTTIHTVPNPINNPPYQSNHDNIPQSTNVSKPFTRRKVNQHKKLFEEAREAERQREAEKRALELSAPAPRGSIVKNSFAEALASVSKEAAAQNHQIQQDSAYAFNYLQEDSQSFSHRNRVNLQEDREKVAEARRKIFSPRRNDEDSDTEEPGEGEEKMLEWMPSSPETSDKLKKRKSARFRNPDDINDDGGVRETEATMKAPFIRKKSLIYDAEECKAYWIQGFIAMKHGRSGQPKKKQIKFDEEEETIMWQPAIAKRSSSLLGLFSSKKATEIGTILISDIVEVKKGVETEVLSKAGLLDPSCCLSMITAERTLDLVFDNTSERNKALNGLKVLLDGKDVKFN